MATDAENDKRISKAATEFKKLDAKLKEVEAENKDLRLGLNRLFAMADEILDGQRRLRDLFRHTEMEFTQTKIHFKELDKGNVENYYWLKDSLNKYLKENKLPTINDFLLKDEADLRYSTLHPEELGELTKEKKT